MNLTKTILFIFIAVATIFFACKKNKENIEQKAQEEDNTAAKHNNGILPGAGNFFISKSFLPGQATQLIAKLAYNGDSVFYFGSSNAEAKITRLHTVMVSKGAGKYFVTEYGDDNASTISYHIRNGVKDQLVAKTTLFSATMKEISLLNYDWVNGTSELLAAVTYKDNIPVKTSAVKSSGSAKTSAAATSSVNTWTKDCGTPAPENESDQDKFLYNSLQHIQCNGTHPINEPWLVLDGKVKDLPKTDDIVAKFTDLKNSGESFTSIFSKMKSAINQLMPTMGTFDQMVWLQKLLKKFEADNQIKGLLKLSEANSDLVYQEGVDKYVKVVLSLTDPNTDMPHKLYSGLTTVTLKKGNTIVYDEIEYTSKVDGNATFLINIADIPELESTSKLTGEYGFKNQPGKNTFEVSLKWIVPVISIYSGQNQDGEYGKKIKNPLVIKIVDSEGNPVNKWPVSWSVKSGNGFIASDTETNASGLAEASWTLGGSGEQEIEATAKSKDGSAIPNSTVGFKAVMPCSQSLAPVINDISFKCNAAGEYGIYVSFTSAGSDLMVGGGSGTCDLKQNCYPARLLIRDSFGDSPDFSVAANSYYVKLFSGTLREGVLEFRMSYTGNCIPGKSAREAFDYYYSRFSWKVQVMNQCNKRSAEVSF
ncbi:MAG TPA: Ig-like domain-containing protein [Pedobacter sp.]|uniref:Ig-like domain-containing protein n=1 Tax=Pedobacter sp. TaxID=1411316 RepID=UPI002CC2A430|nr:Ig-like domain-containing protein [Pedobacter sp.]HMI03201.1 Ig-like domain-containing protein [Pedobacter sp.]